jgi:hypothetical protein
MTLKKPNLPAGKFVARVHEQLKNYERSELFEQLILDALDGNEELADIMRRMIRAELSLPTHEGCQQCNSDQKDLSRETLL